MATRSHGLSVGTRRKFKKKPREKGKIRIRAALENYKTGESVIIKVDSSYHKGMPYKRFLGKQGKILEKRGNSYVIEIKDGNKQKTIICAPLHIKRI